ncbi:uncharacterized protein LOC133193035 [Saccostrea echinata]|uniref:uncharacterized protein LOC133193035 n=1 Tax=Saccostrea echinata TaxID=191078 RepID=UPI002A838054|nr:uncharacterized protein LOC133193035 [Saccostrea echinata]
MSDRSRGSLQQDTGTEDVDSTRSDSSTNSSENESEDLRSANSENEIEDGSFVSKEEDNCLRYFLGIGIAEKAVRMWFDTIIPPGQLENHLKRHEKKLRKTCNDEQISNLFPGYGTVTSTSFDISLLYKIIRNTTKVRKPRKDWGGTPDATDIEQVDDLERVRICRNSLCHGPQSISDNEFEKKWKELKEIIQRLAGGQLDGEMDSLQNKDLDHSARSSVKRSLAVLTERLQDVEKRVEDHIPKHIREQHQNKIQKWKEDDKLFARVPAYQSVRDKIKSLPYVSVTGSGGTGKTFLIRHIALELSQDRFEIIPVSTIGEISLYGKLHFKQLFVLDDVLGVYGLDMSLYNNLSRQSENLLSLLESGSKLLISCRSVVFKESKSLNSFVTYINHVINMDDEENELNDENIKTMLENHCKNNHVQKKYFEDLKLPRKIPMFPLLCRLFSSTQKYQTEGEHFFLHPYQCIFSELDKMLELKKLHYAGLVYFVMKDNCVYPKSLDRKCLTEVYECCRLNRSTSNSEFVHAMHVLEGSYLMQDTEVHFGSRFQDFFIEHCTSSSIYYLLKFVEEGSTSSENMIPVVVDHFPVLVERIICDIKRFNLYEVFSRIGQFSQNEVFVSVFCKTLKNSRYDDFKHLFFEIETTERLNKKTKKLLLEINQKLDNVLERKTELRLSLLNESHARVVNWIIAYNHVDLLSGLIEIVREKIQLDEGKVCLTDNIGQDILGVIFGNDLESQSVCLSLACSSSSLDMVKLILSYVKHECINCIADDNLWSLAVASCFGCTDIVRFLLREGANVNLRDKRNASCLIYSCSFGNYDVVETLIKEGADVNLLTLDGISPLISAIFSGNAHLVRHLITNGADINLCGEDWPSPLVFASFISNLDVLKCLIHSDADVNIDARCLTAACLNGNRTVVEYLINKVDVNKVYDNCNPALHAAVSSGNLGIVEYLVEHGADVNLLSSSDENPLYCCIINGQSHVIRYLVEHGADINQNLGNIKTFHICIASGEGYLEIVEELIKHGADVNLCDLNGKSPLCYASNSGHLETVKYLLQNDADINVGTSCLSSACESGHLNVVEFLIDKIDVNKVNDICYPALHCASAQGHLDIVEYLVEHEADVNLMNSANESPLYSATENGQLHLEIVRELIKRGADVNLCDDNGASPLFLASKSGHLDIVKILLQNDADINVGASCLSSACKSGHLDVVKFLIDKLDVNKVNDICDPALHCASGQGHIEIIKYLVEHGANVNLLSSSKDSPLCCAVEKGQLPVVEYLVEHGADINQAVEIAIEGGLEDILDFIEINQRRRIKPFDSYPMIIQIEFLNWRIPACESICEKLTSSRYVTAIGSPGRGKTFLIGHIALELEQEGFEILPVSSIEQIIQYGKLNVKQLFIVDDELGVYGLEMSLYHNLSRQTEIVFSLLESGSKLLMSCLCGYLIMSPICCASSQGYLEIVKYLIRSGAGVNCCDINGKSSFDYALANGHQDIYIVKCLKNEYKTK